LELVLATAYNSNFFGNQYQGATTAIMQISFGYAGQGAINAYNSNFFGQQAGYGATGAYSNFRSNAGLFAATGALIKCLWTIC
jgi:hypothetical protein